MQKKSRRPREKVLSMALMFFTQCGGAAGVDVPVSRSGGGNDVFYLLYCAGSAVGIYGN